ncbi:hypothetical protein N792_02430 [Lysobacter concretionis Ko07 = DSM 16239]|uniref:Uncharacterized protein n=1 Tax=Lysobacter concretionis Ko07 = DSM 16239 TaxID=1122185 RepID=A0A0A0EIV0_9GAMM|nr:hypothetical protein N792_02430 [Lysobacter concretionis Ko07 = DSM 16239]
MGALWKAVLHSVLVIMIGMVVGAGRFGRSCVVRDLLGSGWLSMLWPPAVVGIGLGSAMVDVLHVVMPAGFISVAVCVAGVVISTARFTMQVGLAATV